MNTKAQILETEERLLQEQLEALQQDLDVLKARLNKVTEEKEKLPRLRGLRTGFGLVSSVAPVHEGPPTHVVPAPAPEAEPDWLALLHASPRGSALFVPRDVEGAREVALLVRSDPGRLARLGTDPKVNFRAGVFTQDETGLSLVPVLVCLGPEEPENIYEAWLNDDERGMLGTLEALATQEAIVLELYGDGCRLERTLRVPNPLRPFAAAARRLVAGMRPWSSDALHQARTNVYRQYPRVRSLWRALTAHGER